MLQPVPRNFSLSDSRATSIVAVHGLNGHPLKTWTENDVIWFSDFLPKQLPDFDLRVCTFGYNSKVLFSGTVFQVRDFGMQLLSSLDLKRKKVRDHNVYSQGD
jgi:hypothetical protein